MVYSSDWKKMSLIQDYLILHIPDTIFQISVDIADVITSLKTYFPLLLMIQR